MAASVSRNRTHLGWILPLVVVVTSCGFPLAARHVAEGVFEDRLSVTGPLDLDVRSGSGGIEIRTGEAGTVQVTGSVRARASGSYQGLAQDGNGTRGRLRSSPQWPTSPISSSIHRQADR